MNDVNTSFLSPSYRFSNLARKSKVLPRARPFYTPSGVFMEYLVPTLIDGSFDSFGIVWRRYVNV